MYSDTWEYCVCVCVFYVQDSDSALFAHYDKIYKILIKYVRH